MRINLNTLPIEIQERIPISIRVNNFEYDLEDLPDDLRVLIEDHLRKKPKDISYSESVRDTKPELTVYNDITPLNLKESIVEYFKNYISTSYTSYPFDVTFGSRLKEYLQTKDTNLMHMLISAELQNIVNVLTNDYNLPIKIISARVFRTSDERSLVPDQYTGYILQVELKILEEITTLNIMM